MEPIRDLSWIAQAAGGETLERFTLNGYSAVSILVSARADHRGGTYRYRMLFAENPGERPVYAVNLETSILGEWLVTEQAGTDHKILHRLPNVVDYERFRVLALERAVSRLEKKN
jgi:hypothetical protein